MICQNVVKPLQNSSIRHSGREPRRMPGGVGGGFVNLAIMFIVGRVA